MNTDKKLPGRPRLAESARKQRTIMIDDHDLNIILSAGNGNKSEGVHLLAEFYKKHALNKPILS